jgi:sodium transport system permease protein
VSRGRPGARTALARQARAVFRIEMLGLVRDRRALVSAIVLPVLIYPLILWAHGWMQRVSREARAAREVRVALDLRGAPAELASDLRALLEQEIPIDLVAADAERLREIAEAVHEGRPEAIEAERRIARELLAGRADLLVTHQAHPVLASRPLLRVHYDGAEEHAREALERVRRAIGRLEERSSAQRVQALFGASDPARGLAPQTVDVATPEREGGAFLGRFLPLVAVLVLVSGGAYAALSAFAGEREGRTLETLLSQPVPAAAFAWAKLGAVLVVAIAALFANVGSMLGSLALGLGDFTSLAGEATAGASPSVGLTAGRVLLATAFLLPSAVIVCSVLVLASARARTFREGQYMLLPLTLLAALPAGLAGYADLEFDPLLAAVPLLGPCLALRDALRGEVAAVPVLVMVASSALWAWLALRRLGTTLDAERILVSRDHASEHALRRIQSRQALRWGAIAALASYLAGGWMQSRWGLPGFLATLWILLPALALLAARGTARRSGEGLARALELRVPRAEHALGALLLAPALALAMLAFIPWQQRVLPLPSSALEDSAPAMWLATLPTWGKFLVLALSPGITEELLFRGAIQSGLRRDMPARSVVLWQAALFAVAHASIYRFVPIAMVGALLSAVALRGRSVVPAILLHVAYDALLVLEVKADWLSPWPAAGLAAAGLLLLGRGTPSRLRDPAQASLPA